jgi:putative transposase
VANNRMELVRQIRKWLEEDADDMLRQMLRVFAQVLMGADADQLCGAEHGSRSSERVNHRNGYRGRRWDTRVGTIDLMIPKLRKGTYFPDFLLEPRRRSERALVNVIAESYINGVSTRKTEKLVEAMGIVGISKSQVSEMTKTLDEVVADFRGRSLEGLEYPIVWLDAMQIKTREAGHVVKVATVIATAVSSEGHREIIGVDVFTSEDEAAWTDFLRGLKARGLNGVKLVISDANKGLVNAVGAVMPGTIWQRCRTHFMTNLLARVPKAAQGLVASLVRSIFNQMDAEQVWKQHATVVDQLATRFPEAAELLDEAAHDILAFTSFPRSAWRQIWSNNPQERLNKEVRRRTDVVGIFPNRAAIIRLVGALLCEQNEEWCVTRRYMSLGVITAVRAVGTDETPPTLPGKEAALESGTVAA